MQRIGTCMRRPPCLSFRFSCKPRSSAKTHKFKSHRAVPRRSELLHAMGTQNKCAGKAQADVGYTVGNILQAPPTYPRLAAYACPYLNPDSCPVRQYKAVRLAAGPPRLAVCNSVAAGQFPPCGDSFEGHALGIPPTRFQDSRNTLTSHGNLLDSQHKFTSACCTNVLPVGCGTPGLSCLRSNFISSEHMRRLSSKGCYGRL